MTARRTPHVFTRASPLEYSAADRIPGRAVMHCSIVATRARLHRVRGPGGRTLAPAAGPCASPPAGTLAGRGSSTGPRPDRRSPRSRRRPLAPPPPTREARDDRPVPTATGPGATPARLVGWSGAGPGRTAV